MGKQPKVAGPPLTSGDAKPELVRAGDAAGALSPGNSVY